MKCLSIALLFFAGWSLAAQTTVITVEAPTCPQLKLYEFNGVGFQEAGSFAKDQTGNWTLKAPAPTTAMRYVGSRPNDALPVLLGEPTLTIQAVCGKMRSGKTVGSALNDGYQELKRSFQAHNKDFQQAQRGYITASNQGDSTAMRKHRGVMAHLDERKLAQLKATKAENPVLGRIAALNTYLSFANNNDGRANELDYYVNNYFRHVDFDDAGYNDLPWTHESSRSFATVLAQVIPGEQLGQLLMSVYNRWPAGSRAQLFAMSGGFAALSQKKHPAAIILADAMEERFAAAHPTAIAQIRSAAAGLRTFSIGAEAPLFAGNDPEGNEITLESLRGKVVLIDFWASWCGPCRKENPNVVRVYKRFRDQGFEILGVSLDRTKDRWVKAIAADKLTWPQISDLKGWQSAVAKQYGVSSIPQTVLLDREGRILARNLRGQALEDKLAEVFSE